MTSFILVIIAAFLAATIAMLAVGLFIRDLFTKPEDPNERKRLELVPAEAEYGLSLIHI